MAVSMQIVYRDLACKMSSLNIFSHNLSGTKYCLSDDESIPDDTCLWILAEDLHVGLYDT